MADLTLEAFDRVMQKGSAEFRHVVRKRLSAAGVQFKANARQNAQRRFKRSTGATANSTFARLHPRRDELHIGIDTDKAPGALIQDRGGVIRPRRGPFLYIPQPDGSLRVVRETRIRATHWFTDAAEKLQRDTPAALEGALAESLGVR